MSAAGEPGDLRPITFPSKNAQGDGMGVVITNTESKRGLIVIHEWWGMNTQIQSKARQLAAAEGGFTVLVPDMYRGRVAVDREEAGHLMTGLDWTGAVQDIAGAAQYLKSVCGCVAVGVTGFCMGGALAFAAAALCPAQISAAAPFYGIPNPQLADLGSIRIPVQAHFGEQDTVKGFSSPEDYTPLRDRLLAAGVPLQMYTYNAGHAFTNADNPNYDKQAATLAFSRMLEFMKKHLN